MVRPFQGPLEVALALHVLHVEPGHSEAAGTQVNALGHIVVFSSCMFQLQSGAEAPRAHDSMRGEVPTSPHSLTQLLGLTGA